MASCIFKNWLQLQRRESGHRKGTFPRLPSDSQAWVAKAITESNYLILRCNLVRAPLSEGKILENKKTVAFPKWQHVALSQCQGGMAQCFWLQSPLVCFRSYICLCDACLLPGRCFRAHGMAENSNLAPPGSLFTARRLLRRCGKSRFLFAEFPGTASPKPTHACLPQSRGCVVQ